MVLMRNSRTYIITDMIQYMATKFWLRDKILTVIQFPIHISDGNTLKSGESLLGHSGCS